MNMRRYFSRRKTTLRDTPKGSSYKFYWSIGKCLLDVNNLNYKLDQFPLLGQNYTFFDFRTDDGVVFTDYFVCDPFLISFKGKLLIFFEICGYVGDKYVTAIAKVETNESLTFIENFSVVKYANDKAGVNRTHTISYPYPIIVQGELYLVIEEYSQQLETQVYKYDLQLNNLDAVGSIPISIYDPNIHEIDGFFWIYGIDDEYSIRVFMAETIAGPYIEHGSSGLYKGKDFARNAGAVFKWNGSLIRPFQDCSDSYGKSLGFSRISIDKTSGFQILDDLPFNDLRITGRELNPYWATSKSHHFAALNVSDNSICGLVDAARKLHITNHAWTDS